ncbi:MAG: hypothetical protein M1355_02070 [Patescibacteria group bacterium]|nr:hypothetical protein [Patescibacteria group bacterium]
MEIEKDPNPEVRIQYELLISGYDQVIENAKEKWQTLINEGYAKKSDTPEFFVAKIILERRKRLSLPEDEIAALEKIELGEKYESFFKFLSVFKPKKKKLEG